MAFDDILGFLGIGNNTSTTPLGFSPTSSGNDAYYYNNFNTNLDQTQEQNFQDWLAKQSLKTGQNLSDLLKSYDLRSYWLGNQGDLTTADLNNLSSKFNKPNSSTFGSDSIYNTSITPSSGQNNSQATLGNQGQGFGNGQALNNAQTIKNALILSNAMRMIGSGINKRKNYGF